MASVGRMKIPQVNVLMHYRCVQFKSAMERYTKLTEKLWSKESRLGNFRLIKGPPPSSIFLHDKNPAQIVHFFQFFYLNHRNCLEHACDLNLTLVLSKT